MPDLQAIERIKDKINQLADEPAILSELGIELEDIQAPEKKPDDELEALLDDDLEMESTDLNQLITQNSNDEMDPFSDLDEIPSADLSDNLDLEEGGLNLDDSFADDSFDFESPIDDDLDSPDIETPVDESFDDIDELPADEDLSDLGDNADLDESSDFGESFDIEDLEDLGDAEDLEDLEDLGEEMTLAPEGENPPDILSTLETLSADIEDAEDSGEMDSIDIDDDFGLNEIGDDFLEEMEDDSEGRFSLDDLGQDFSLIAEEQEISSDIGLDLDSLEKSIDDEDLQSREDDFELTTDEMNQLKTELYQYPRNLKIALEELLADPETPVDQLNRIINNLINRAPIKSIASQVSKISGKKINVPRGYQKLNVQEYQKERNSFFNLFGEQVWPRLATGLIGFAAIWLLFILSFNYLYRPLKAHNLYTSGQEQILLDHYDRAEFLFDQAFYGWTIGTFKVKGWPKKEWYYLYAESYQERKKFDRASDKYRDLLMNYRGDKKGRLDYADLLTLNMADYQSAVKILLNANPVYLIEVERGERTYSDVPVKELAEIDDYDLLLKLGDAYFFWGEQEFERYEDARYTYAFIRDFINGGDEIHLRMLRYFMTMNIGEEVERWIPVFKEKKKIYAEPTFQAEVLSEIAGWLLDQRRFGEAGEFLAKANEADKTIPDVHYQYARYFRMTHNLEREKGALTNALGYLTRQNSIRKKYIFMRIDSYKRIGELEQSKNDILQAERNYLMALSIFEDSRDRNLIGTSHVIGDLYEKVGDINYLDHLDYNQALRYFRKAEENLYDTPDLHYKMGYIYYTHQEEFDRALLEFYKSSRALPSDRNIMFAMANTLYEREDYFGSVSHYERLLTQLREEEQRIGLLVPDQKEEHLALIIQLMKVFNNLGAAEYKVAERSPNRAMVSESLSHFTYASEYYDKLTRNRDTLVRSRNPDLGYQNRMTLLHDRAIGALDGQDVLIFKELLSDMDALPLNY